MISKSLFDSPTGSTGLFHVENALEVVPSRQDGEKSSTSSVGWGEMMSAKRQSFSSHGCWATLHSILGIA
jgi:hypothetical protein